MLPSPFLVANRECSFIFWQFWSLMSSFLFGSCLRGVFHIHKKQVSSLFDISRGTTPFRTSTSRVQEQQQRRQQQQETVVFADSSRVSILGVSARWAALLLIASVASISQNRVCTSSKVTSTASVAQHKEAPSKVKGADWSAKNVVCDLIRSFSHGSLFHSILTRGCISYDCLKSLELLYSISNKC